MCLEAKFRLEKRQPEGNLRYRSCRISPCVSRPISGWRKASREVNLRYRSCSISPHVSLPSSGLSMSADGSHNYEVHTYSENLFCIPPPEACSGFLIFFYVSKIVLKSRLWSCDFDRKLPGTLSFRLIFPADGHCRKSTNYRDGNPTRNSDVAFTTIFRISKWENHPLKIIFIFSSTRQLKNYQPSAEKAFKKFISLLSNRSFMTW